MVLKRNSQYCLILGIKWGKFLNIKKEIENWKSKGIGSIEYDKNYFNNYPYFNEKGDELIHSIPPSNKENLTEFVNIKKEKLKKFYQKGKEKPYLIPLKRWIYNPPIMKRKFKEKLVLNEIFLDENQISEEERIGILEGRNSIFEYILERNPLVILNSVIVF